MSNQSDIQSLIQTLQGTHTAGQASAPSSVNNGNPNTIYNAPSMNAQGQMYSQLVNPAASIGALQLPALPGWGAPNTGGGVGGLLDIRPVFGGWTGGGITPTVPGTPGTGTPTGTPPANNVNNGGGPVLSPTPTGGTAPGRGVVVSTPPLSSTGPGGNVLVGPGYGATAGGAGTGYRGNLSGLFPSVNDTTGQAPWLTSLLQGADLTSGGGVLEILDKLTEPFLQGDMVQNGDVNWRALMASLGDKALGPLDDLLMLIPGLRDKVNEWVNNGYSKPGSAPTGDGFVTPEFQSALDQILSEVQRRMQEDISNGGSRGPTSAPTNNTDAMANAMATRSGNGIGWGWTGISGDAARNVWDGMRRGSDAAIRQADYDAFVRNNVR